MAVSEYIYTITKDTDCTLSICSLINTQSPDVGHSWRHDLVIPTGNDSTIDEVTSYEVTRKNSCCSETETTYTIYPIPGNLTAAYIDIAGGGTTTEYLRMQNNSTLPAETTYEFLHTRYGVTQKYQAASTNDEFTGASGTTGVVTSSFDVDDLVTITVTLPNGAYIQIVYEVTANGANIIGVGADPTFTLNSRTLVTPYTLDASDCLLLQDNTSFAQKDGVWSVSLKVNYEDATNNPHSVTTTKCVFVDCNNLKCDTASKIAALFDEGKPTTASELVLAKEAIQYAIDCNRCCAACDIYEYYYAILNDGNCYCCSKSRPCG